MPFAKRLLIEGWDFFSSQESIGVAPGTYVWPALFGAVGTTIKMANFVCGIFMVVLVYLIGLRLHSQTAGVISSLFFSLSPMVLYLIPTAQTEPQFFLFTLLWIWGTCEVCHGKAYHILIASLSLSLSILIRSVWWYPSIILFFALLVLSFLIRKDKETFQIIKHLVVLFFCALILPTAFIIRNYIMFNFPTFSTGAGLQVFYGAHLLTGGFEPPLIGLNYGAPLLSNDLIVQEKKIMLLGMEFLKSRSLIENFFWFFKKISWVISFTTLEADKKMAFARSVEFGLASLSTIWSIRHKKYLVLLFSLAVLCQVFQTALVLYNIRYSVGNLELLLIPLAGVGLAILINTVTFKQKILLASFGLLIFILTLILHFNNSPKIEYGHHIPQQILYQVAGDGVQVSKTEKSYQIPFVDTKGFDQILWKIELSNVNNCTHVYTRFELLNFPKGRNIYLKKHNEFIDGFIIGTGYENITLFPKDAGKFIIGYQCPNGLNPKINRLSIIGSTLFATTWRKINLENMP